MSRRTSWLLAAALALAVAGVFWWQLFDSTTDAAVTAATETAATAVTADAAALPVVAVLPFANLDETGENSSFARGLHEDVLTRLAGLDTALEQLETAVAADPGFAQAWALLAQARAEHHSKLSELDDREEDAADAADAARAALAEAKRLAGADDNEMIVAMFEGDFDRYAAAWANRWDRHHANHCNWACPAQINDEANQAHLLLEHGRVAEAETILDRARHSTSRPFTEKSQCIFDRAVVEPKIEWLSGDHEAARQEFDDAVLAAFSTTDFPRGPVERSVLLETADLVAPGRVYEIYRRVTDEPISLVSMETICADPWTFSNLLKDPKFIAEVRADGRFVEFLEHYRLLEPEA